MIHNSRLRCALSLVATLVCAAPLAQAQTLTVGFSEQLRGGLAVNAWGELSTPTTFVSGRFQMRIPRDGRVRRAVLYTAAVSRTMGATFVAGPAATPRQVIVGSGATAVTATIEGTARYSSRTGPYFWGTFVTDVTAAVRPIVGPTAPGGIIDVPVRERGDDGPNIDAPVTPNHVEVTGHTLAVEYELDFGPMRNLVVYEGSVTTGSTSWMVPMPGPVANRCPTGSTRGEPFAASVAIPSEYDVCQEDNTITVNGRTLTTTAGGGDDWPSGPSTGCDGRSAALISAGSFGGTEPGPGSAAGSAAGTNGDNISGPPAAPRRDDELYDFRPFINDGDTTISFGFRGSADESLNFVAVQTLARLAPGDADRDGVSDVIEGDCTVDTDADGTPDYLDPDSDNDCLADSSAAEAGGARVSATMPGSADSNCGADRPVCDRPTGECVAISRTFFEDWETGTSRWRLNEGHPPLPALEVTRETTSGCTRFQRETLLESGGRFRTVTPVAVDAARTYCLAAWIRGSAGTQPFIGAYPTDVGATFFRDHTWIMGVGAFSSPWRAAGVVLPITADGTWRWYSTPFRVPAGVSYIGLMNELFAAGSEGTADFDDIAIYEGGCPAAPPTPGPRACPSERPVCGAAGTCAECVTDGQCTSGTRRVCDAAAGSCVECRADTDCRGSTPACARGVCVACTSNAQCSGATPVCETVRNVCRACVAADCSGATPACATTGSSAGRCVACTSDAQCSGATPICDGPRNVCRACGEETRATDCPTAALPQCAAAGVNAGRCVACTASPQCATALPVCAATNVCEACTSDAQCPMDRPACALSGVNSGRCVRCASDAQCGAMLRCDVSNLCVGCRSGADCSGSTPVCDLPTQTCRGCTATDCSGATPACALSGPMMGRCAQCAEGMTAACTGATPVCDAALNLCVGCVTRADCMGATPVCDAAARRCRACAEATRAADCPSADAPFCAASGASAGRCVQCESGAQCSGSTPVCGDQGRCEACTSDAQCPMERRVCVTSGVGQGSCAPCARDSDCGPSRRCESGATPAENRCVMLMADASVADVTTPDAAAPDAPDDLGIMDGGATPRVALSGSGCACHAAVGSTSSRGLLALAALAAVALSRRRRGVGAARSRR